MRKFQKLGINDLLVKSVENLGYDSPTEVQSKVIPILLNKESDIVALAQTGTGKTAAFGLPILQKIDSSSKNTQGLILSPTRELCLQITEDLKTYSEFIKGLNIVAVYGGASITEQSKKIKKGAQIIVATPGRILDMIKADMKKRKKPKVFLTTSSSISCFPIFTGSKALECNIRRVSSAAYFTNSNTRITFIPPVVEPPIPPINISTSNSIWRKIGQIS